MTKVSPKYRGDILIVPLIFFILSHLFLKKTICSILKSLGIKVDIFLVPKFELIIYNIENLSIYIAIIISLIMFIRVKFFSLSINEKSYNINYSHLKGLNFESNDIDLTSVVDCDLKMSPWNLVTATAKLVINSRSEERQVIERLSYSDAKKLQLRINEMAINNYSEYRIKKDYKRK